MKTVLVFAFLFFIGSVIGWVIELFFRRFFSVSNPERKWINPGFCVGPYLPIYGFGLCFMYLIASLEKYSFFSSPLLNKIVLFLVMSLCMTVIEFVAGMLALKVMKVRLWDYSNEWGNIKGVICPLFSLIWAVLGALYYFFVHPYILEALDWLSQNLAFSFFIGLFFGVFIIDLVHSAQLVAKFKKFADDNEIVVKFENLKSHIRSMHDRNSQKYNFFLPFHTDVPLGEYMKEHIAGFVEKIRKNK